MAFTIVEILDQWRAEESQPAARESSADLRTWASVFGTDVGRAWAECARGDYLVVVAAACGAPLEPAVLAAIGAAEDAQNLLPPRLAAGRRALVLARTLLDAKVDFMALKADVAAAHARLRQAAARRERTAVLRAAERDRLYERVCRDLSKRMHAAMTASTLPPADEETSRAHEIALRASEVHVRFRATKLAEAFALAETRLQQAELEQAALGAADRALGAATGVVLNRLLAATRERAANLGPVGAEVYLEATTRFAETHENAVIGVSAAFSSAAEAFASAAAATTEAASTVLFELGTVALDAVFGKRLGVDEGEALARRARKAAAAARDEKLRAHADALRASIPFSSLRPPLDDADVEALEPGEGRAVLLERCAHLAPALRVWGDERALEALEVVSAMLAAPGPVDRGSLARALGTMHERTAALFAAHAAEATEPAAQAEALAAAAGAREAAREIEEMLDEREDEPLN